MYDFIEKDEYLSPQESLKKYMYFSGEDELPQEHQVLSTPQLLNINVTDLHRNDFEELLKNSDLPEDEKKHYHAQFVKTKRIYKRERAKMRFGGAQSLALMPVELPIEHFAEDRAAEEHSTTKAESDTPDKDEDQKRKKRMSAQISRDRKKLYIEKMEVENQKLRERTAQLEAENSILKKDMEALKKKEHTKITSIKSFFIMSLILLTSVNKHIHKLDAQLNLSQETLMKHAAEILSEYSRNQIKIVLPQLEEFKSRFAHESEIKQEEIEMKVEPQAILNKPIIFGQTFQSRSLATGVKKEAGIISRRLRGKQGKSILESQAA